MFIAHFLKILLENWKKWGKNAFLGLFLNADWHKYVAPAPEKTGENRFLEVWIQKKKEKEHRW